MAKVPRNRNSQVERLRSGRQKSIIVGGVPIPAGEDPLMCHFTERGSLLRREIRDKVASQSKLMRTLERGRFRSTFFEEVRLPSGIAVRLEDFEAGLRSAGLMGVDQVLVQSLTSPTKFRVGQREVVVNRHSGSPVSVGGYGHDAGSPALPHSAVGRPRVKGAPSDGEPSLPRQLTRPKLVRKKGA